MLRAHRLAIPVAVLAAFSLLVTPAPRSTSAAVDVTDVLGWAPGVSREVPLRSPVVVYFNRAMDRASVREAWRISPGVAGAFHWSPTSLSYVPARPLRPNTTYRITIGSAARSSSGVGLRRPVTIRFSTGDVLRVLNYSPWSGTRGVPASGRLSFTFNHPMVPLAGLSHPVTNPAGWNLTIAPHVAGHGSWIGTSMWVFYPTGALQLSTRYTVALRGSVRDSAGERLGRDLRWSFITTPRRS